MKKIALLFVFLFTGSIMASAQASPFKLETTAKAKIKKERKTKKNKKEAILAETVTKNNDSVFMPTKIAAKTTNSKINGAAFKFDDETLDYGTIENESDGNREFTFTNVGNAPLIISNAVGSCGCTVPTWPQTPILPGESSTIKVKYATERTGAFSKSITLTSNDVKEPTKVIRIKGKVLPPTSEKKSVN